MAIVISAVNRKGGVGKTSTVYHLAGYFAKEGARVLLVDNDPQHSLSAGIFGPEGAEQFGAEQTVAALFDDRFDPLADDVIRPSGFDGISIIPGSDELTRFNIPEPEESGAYQLALRDFLAEVRDRFDLVFIDNPPNIQLCTWASLVASDFAICVSQPEDYGSQGCVAVQKAIDAVLAQVNGSLRLAGYVLNMVNGRLSIHKAYEGLLRQLYGNKVFRTKLPLATHFKEAIAERKPVTMYKPRSTASRAVKELGVELLERIATLAGSATEFEYAGNVYPNGPDHPQRPPETVKGKQRVA